MFLHRRGSTIDKHTCVLTQRVSGNRKHIYVLIFQRLIDTEKHMRFNTKETLRCKTHISFILKESLELKTHVCFTAKQIT